MAQAMNKVNAKLDSASETLEKIIRKEITQRIIDEQVEHLRNEITPIVTEAVKSVTLERFRKIQQDWRMAEELDVKLTVNDIVLRDDANPDNAQ